MISKISYLSYLKFGSIKWKTVVIEKVNYRWISYSQLDPERDGHCQVFKFSCNYFKNLTVLRFLKICQLSFLGINQGGLEVQKTKIVSSYLPWTRTIRYFSGHLQNFSSKSAKYLSPCHLHVQWETKITVIHVYSNSICYNGRLTKAAQGLFRDLSPGLLICRLRPSLWAVVLWGRI